MDLMLFVPFAASIVTGLTQVAKRAHYPEHLASLLEVALGVTFTVTGVASGAVTTSAFAAPAALFWAAAYGVVVGLMAGGLWTYIKVARDSL